MTKPTTLDLPNYFTPAQAAQVLIRRIESIAAHRSTESRLPPEEERDLRRLIQRDAAAQVMTADTVFAYAKLHLVTDDGYPVVPAPHHRLWVELLTDPNIFRLLIIAPPESAKTTWVISAYIGCKMGIFPEQSVIVASSSGGTATKRSQSLRSMTEHPDWQRTFPNVNRAVGMRWDLSEWSIAPSGKPYPGRLHPTVSAYGPEGSIVGSRAHEVVGDDIHDQDNSRTLHQRQLIAQWYDNSVMTRLHARIGRVRIIGTRWHPQDLYRKLQEAGDYVVCHTPILSESEDVYATITYPPNWPHPMIGEVQAHER